MTSGPRARSSTPSSPRRGRCWPGSGREAEAVANSKPAGNKQTDIIAAAARLFSDKGYHAATVQDIADEVGILKGSLY
ncbi:MAG: helix-turn-helix transcriptional regulator, partial [Candidatus Rokubacteria bacterium]|nr:helix-turn-helix transcriptional regulator [Candidatus Rokubacteria bacterium]